MLKPTNVLFYLHYECPECGAVEEYRLSEINDEKFVCEDCGYAEERVPIEGITVNYKKPKRKVNPNLLTVKVSLKDLGYSGNQAKMLIGRVTRFHPKLESHDDILKQALIEASNVYGPKT